jgi:hypothetical protein
MAWIGRFICYDEFVLTLRQRAAIGRSSVGYRIATTLGEAAG